VLRPRELRRHLRGLRAPVELEAAGAGGHLQAQSRNTRSTLTCASDSTQTTGSTLAAHGQHTHWRSDRRCHLAIQPAAADSTMCVLLPDSKPGPRRSVSNASLS
jgi:hypothetical protein